jgi:FtsX extracellular domain
MCKFLLLLTIVFFSCHNNKVNVADFEWKSLDSARGIFYSVAEPGKGEKGSISVTYFGWGDSTIRKDTSEEYQKLYDLLIAPLIKDKKEWIGLPKGSSGYLKVATEDFYRQLLAELKHYTLFLSTSVTADNLLKDSLQLASLRLFKHIEITTQDEAIKKYTESVNDTSWKEFIPENPLPASIELTLKPEFLSKDKSDSAERILARFFPSATIQSAVNKTFSAFFEKLKKVIVFKFVVT